MILFCLIMDVVLLGDDKQFRFGVGDSMVLMKLLLSVLSFFSIVLQFCQLCDYMS